MKHYTEEFYRFSDTIFGDYQLPDLVREVEANRNNGLDIRGFTLGDIQDDPEYRQVITSISIVPMAVGVDFDSLPLPFSNEGFSIEGGSLPRLRTIRQMGEQDIRKVRRAAKMFGASNGQQAALDHFIESIDFHITSQENRQTWFRHQLISRGFAEYTDASNPYGVKKLTFFSRVRSGNVTTKTGTDRWWTDANMTVEGTTSDPIGDMKEVVDNAEYNYRLMNSHFEINRKTAKKLVNHSKVIEAIAASLHPAAASEAWATGAARMLTWEQKLEILGELVGASFVVIDKVSAVEVWNKTTQRFEHPTMEAFAEDAVVLVPDGVIGSMISLDPIRISPEGVHYANFMGGRGLFTFDWDVQGKVERLVSELTALPVLNVPDYIFPIAFAGNSYASVQGTSLGARMSAPKFNPQSTTSPSQEEYAAEGESSQEEVPVVKLANKSKKSKEPAEDSE